MANELVFTCPSCGAESKVVTDKVSEGPKCGKCKQPLAAGSEPFHATDQNFKAAVLSSPLPVLVDFWAEWCGPCRMAAPAVADLARKLAGKIAVAKLNVDESQQTASEYGIGGIPTFMLFKAGKEVARVVGALPKAELEAWVKKQDREI